MATYEIDLSNINDINKFAKASVAMHKALMNDELLDFLANKIKLELNSIISQNLNEDEEQRYIHIYRYGNKFNIEYSKSEIIVSNNSIVKLDPSTWIDKEHFEEKAKNYPNMEIDLAKLVEYGTGIVGEQSKSGPVEGWEYNVNNKNSWAYLNSNGQIMYTSGMEGKFIYYKLSESVKEKAGKWVEEYLKQKGLVD